MIVDSHTHLFPPGTDKIGSANVLLDEMDANNVAVAVILGIYPRVKNDFIAEQGKAHSDRFIWYASVNPNDGVDALELLDYCVEKLGARGLKLHPSMQNFNADEVDLLAPIMEKAQDHEIPVLMHSWGWFGHNQEAPPIRMMTLAEHFPEVTFIMAHCGGMRFMDLLPLARRRRLGLLDNLYVDLSIVLFDLDDSPMWPFLRWTLESIGLDRVLMGSDFPDYSLADTIALTRKLDFDDEAMQMILGRNAARLYGLKA
jgi:predicted TIM-barrel fold metal-dependent hydrolase